MGRPRAISRTPRSTCSESLQRRQFDGAELDRAAFRLKADGSRPHGQAVGFVDLLAVDCQAELVTLERDLVFVPLAERLLGILDLLDPLELSEHLVVDLDETVFCTVDVKTEEPPDIAGVAMLQLGLGAGGQEVGRSAGDSQQYTAVAPFARPSPLDDQPIVRVLVFRVQEAERLAFAGQDAVLDAPHVFHFNIRVDKMGLPAVQVLAVEQVDGFRALGLGGHAGHRSQEDQGSEQCGCSTEHDTVSSVKGLDGNVSEIDWIAFCSKKDLAG